MIDRNTLPSREFTNLIYLPPNAPEPYNADGTLNWANSTWPSSNNPFYLTKQKYQVNTNNLIENLSLSYQFTDGLTVKSNFGYTNMTVTEMLTRPIASQNPLLGQPTGSADFTDNKLASWIAEPLLSYQRKISMGKIRGYTGNHISSQ